MSEQPSKGNAGMPGQGPGSGAAKPVTEPPGGPVDEALNDDSQDPGVEQGSRDPDDAGS
jgi:hypothetical protein